MNHISNQDTFTAALDVLRTHITPVHCVCFCSFIQVQFSSTGFHSVTNTFSVS